MTKQAPLETEALSLCDTAVMHVPRAVSMCRELCAETEKEKR